MKKLAKDLKAGDVCLTNETVHGVLRGNGKDYHSQKVKVFLEGIDGKRRVALWGVYSNIFLKSSVDAVK